MGKIKDIRALPYIINEIKNGENSSEFYYSLEKFGKSAEFVLPEFLNIYYTKPSRGMAEVLSNMALESESCREEILDNFIKMFKERQKLSSLEGIAGMGRYAERAVPLLLETVHNKEFYENSMYALASIGTEQAFSALISNLDDFNLVQTLKRLNSESNAERITAVLELSQKAVKISSIDAGFL